MSDKKQSNHAKPATPTLPNSVFGIQAHITQKDVISTPGISEHEPPPGTGTSKSAPEPNVVEAWTSDYPRLDITSGRAAFSENLERVRYKKDRIVLYVRNSPYACLLPMEDLHLLGLVKSEPKTKDKGSRIGMAIVSTKIQHMAYQYEALDFDKVASQVMRDSFGEFVKTVKHSNERILIMQHKKYAAVLAPLSDLQEIRDKSVIIKTGSNPEVFVNTAVESKAVADEHRTRGGNDVEHVSRKPESPTIPKRRKGGHTPPVSQRG
jgi:hypothetical protein